MNEIVQIKAAGEAKWDCAAFGEVMLRFDPGFGRVRNARNFQVWEGGGEYNVARAMRKCWDKRATVVARETTRLKRAWKAAGCTLPYMGFNLIPLSVIPEIRITDKGLVTVPGMRILPLFERA